VFLLYLQDALSPVTFNVDLPPLQFQLPHVPRFNQPTLSG